MDNNEVHWKEKLRYRIDNLFSRGPAALIAGLGGLSLAVVLLAGLALTLGGFTPEGETRLGFGEAVWRSLMRTLDPGTMGGDTGWGFRIVMLLVTMGGIFIISTLIGVLASGIEGKLEELRKGRSRVLESGHTVILGWSEQVFTIVSELVVANENQPRSCIVIMGHHDKVEMEDALRDKVGSGGRTRLVCRSGSPMELADLEIVSLNSSRSIIVLSPEADDPDAEVIKTVLAITNYPGRRARPFSIVAEMRDPKNIDVTRVLGKGEVEWVLVGDLIARIIAQTCRQSGLSVVYTELLDFGGDEIYFKAEPALVGETFGAVLNRFETNGVMGLYSPENGCRLNPPMDTVIRPGDELILIAADDDQIFLGPDGQARVRPEAIVTASNGHNAPECTLLLGWNWRASTVLRELDAYVAPGSHALVVADVQDLEAQIQPALAVLKNQSLSYQMGDTTNRRVLDGIPFQDFDHVILLCYSDSLDVQAADARTLVTLLHLRDIADRLGASFSIVSEMLDIRNRNLANVARVDDFIVSDRLISLMLSQISENMKLNAVFTDIFAPEGSEIYLKPAGHYVRPGQPVNFYTVVEAARRAGEVAIGYRIEAQAGDAAHSYGIRINPPKPAEVTLGEADKIVVLANE
ncbi:MAG: hypothetical protein VB089_15100 [Anaerolineaceae bacterium]|nr:hypothetical protein [Anaerolineaceae bacterium]